MLEMCPKQPEPLITAAIFTYRRPRLLEKTLKSVVSQTYRNIKICVYDDASDDETEQIVRTYSDIDNRVSYYRHRVNVGVIKNWNFGFRRVATEYFSLLSDDEQLLPDVYKSALDLFDKHPDCAFIALAPIRVNDKNVKLSYFNSLDPGYYRPSEGFKLLLENGMPCLPATVFKTKFAMDTPIFGDNNCYMDDFLWFLKIASKYPFVTSSDLGAIDIIHSSAESSKSELKNYWPTCPERIHLLISHLDFPASVKMYAEKKLFQRYKHRLIFSLVSSLSRGYLSEVEECLNIIKNYLKSNYIVLVLRLLIKVNNKYPNLISLLTKFIVKNKFKIYDRYIFLKTLFS